MQQLQVPENNNNNNNNMSQLRLTLADFSGNLSEAKTWYRKFTLLAWKYEWDNAEKCLQLSFHLSDLAGVWFSSLSTDNWARLKAAFEKQFLNTEPTLVTKSKLQSREFQPHSETIDEYYSSILSVGATLGRNSEQLATNFMNGLPESIKDFVIGTDNHTMENYLSRARLYLARHPSGANECPQTGACYKCGDVDHWANECPKWPQHDDDNNDIHDDDISDVNQAPKLTNTDNENGYDNNGEQKPKPANVKECDNDVKQSLDPPNIPPETPENINANAPHSPMLIKSRIRTNRQAAVLSILTDTGAKSNLISLSSLALLGNQQPKLRRAPIKLSGANGSELNRLGIVSLFVKLGDAEHLLDFMWSIIFVPRLSLSKLKATIDCASNVIRFGDGPPIRLQDASVTVPIVNNNEIMSMPGNHAIVPCKSRDKVNVRGSHFASRHEHSPYQLIDSIVDVNGSSHFTVCVYNPKTTVVKIPKDTNIGYLTPVTPNCSLFLIDESDIKAILDDIDCDEILFPVQSGKGNGKKKTIKKPSFSRPLDKLVNLMDEEIIRAQIRYNGKLLNDVEREYLIKIVLKYKHAFSLRGELGKSNSLIYHIRRKPDAEHFYRKPFRSSDHEKELMRKEITKLGIVEVSSKNDVPYCSPSMLVAKSDNSARLISDFRILNSCTKVDHYVFPRLDEILTRIGKMWPMYFGQFDLCDSFYLIPLSEESKELMRFTTESHSK